MKYSLGPEGEGWVKLRDATKANWPNGIPSTPWEYVSDDGKTKYRAEFKEYAGYVWVKETEAANEE